MEASQRRSPGPHHLGSQSRFDACALCVGERIDIKGLGDAIPGTGTFVRVGEDGAALVLRYGCVVLFGGTGEERARLLADLAPRIVERFETSPEESMTIQVAGESVERLADGVAFLTSADVAHLVVVGSALAKSALLTHYEASLEHAFREVEPLASSLRHQGRSGRRSTDLVRHIGAALLVEHRLVGRAEVAEKPEVLWDRPDLEGLYARLQEEYDLKERYAALENKLRLLSRTATTVLNLLQAKRSLRVEWLIVILIVIELALSLLDRMHAL